MNCMRFFLFLLILFVGGGGGGRDVGFFFIIPSVIDCTFTESGTGVYEDIKIRVNFKNRGKAKLV